MARNTFSRFTRTRPMHISVFDGQDLRRAILAGHRWLENHRESINALNVFPVPDGDTGTNMSLTMRAATKNIAEASDTAAYVIAEKVSHDALMGARGNSGVILSQILRGLSLGLDKKITFTASDFAAALQEASRLAYRAVMKPVEGTILTVIREAAEAAQQSSARGADITAMLEETVQAAHAAVAKTPDLLPTLKQAGVVDAGGQGLATILEGVLRYAKGESVRPVEVEQHPGVEFHKGQVSIEEEFGYEVVFLVEGEHLDVERIRETIIAMGGVSTVVAGDEHLLKVHTHTPIPGKILDYGVSLGSLQDINIENLQAQSLRYAAESAIEHGHIPASTANGRIHAAPSADLGTSAVAPLPRQQQAPSLTGDIATVAVVAGAGWEEVFRSLGVSEIVPGGQTMNPSTQELLEAVECCPTQNVILLPNNGNVVLSAQQVPQLSAKRVYVVPSDSLPQGVSALLAFNFADDFETNCRSMEAASKSVATAEITTAVRDATINGVSVKTGDIIGLVNGKLVASGSANEQVLHETLAQMNVEQREIITIYYGADISGLRANDIAGKVKAWFPEQEIEVVNGGQPYYTYVISAE